MSSPPLTLIDKVRVISDLDDMVTDQDLYPPVEFCDFLCAVRIAASHL